jgi:hypothetical protein
MKTVDLTISTIIDHLDSGMTWFKKDDTGAGSIQEKYEATDLQIKTIQKHPKLASWEPTKVLFNIIDDLKDEFNNDDSGHKEATVSKSRTNNTVRRENSNLDTFETTVDVADTVKDRNELGAVIQADEADQDGFLAFGR